jgi:geranylgeranyl diphosphate synthase type II
MTTLTELLAKVQTLFEEENFVHDPHQLYDPIDYTLHLGGKRIRPVMLMAAYEMFGGHADEVRNAAIGIETFHNFTLLHDDLMDKSPLRRGKPTVYAKWDPNTAILSGDTMFALAWQYFLKQPHPQQHAILNTFCQTAIEVCDGQQYDMNFETREDVSIDEYMMMIRLKTAVLLAGALKIGALYAEAPDTDIEHLYQFGINLGLAFQLQDDLLDAYGDVSVFGKQTGTDIKDNKKTFLILKALEIASEAQKVILRQLFRQTPEDPTQKIAAVLDIYDKIDIRRHTEEEIAVYFARARQEMEEISLPDERKQTLLQLANKLFGRNR